MLIIPMLYLVMRLILEIYIIVILIKECKDEYISASSDQIMRKNKSKFCECKQKNISKNILLDHKK